MDDLAAEVIASADEANTRDASSQPSQVAANKNEEGQAKSPAQKKGWGGGLSALREKASIQDRLVD
ncbi:hypothetical protein E4U53_000994, partial [Claviceps sorghi]